MPPLTPFFCCQVDAYGGALSYGVRYRLGRGPPEPAPRPDVLLQGHGRQLRAHARATQPDVLNRRRIPFTEVGVLGIGANRYQWSQVALLGDIAVTTPGRTTGKMRQVRQ